MTLGSASPRINAGKLGIDGDAKSYNLRYVLAHEIGLDYQGRDRGLMGFGYHEQFASVTEIKLAGKRHARQHRALSWPP